MLEREPALIPPIDLDASDLDGGVQERIAFQIGAEPHAGDLCPACNKAYLDYDGLLNLSCPNCGYTLAGCYT